MLDLSWEQARAISSEVEPGSRRENASNQESRAPFRFDRNGNGSSPHTKASRFFRANRHRVRGELSLEAALLPDTAAPASAGASLERQHDHAFPGSAAAFAASYSLVSTNRVGTFALRSSSHASAIMIRMPPTLTNSCAKTPWEYWTSIQCDPKDRNTPKQKSGSEC